MLQELEEEGAEAKEEEGRIRGRKENETRRSERREQENNRGGSERWSGGSESVREGARRAAAKEAGRRGRRGRRHEVRGRLIRDAGRAAGGIRARARLLPPLMAAALAIPLARARPPALEHGLLTGSRPLGRTAVTPIK